jgi:hypothetical protein
MIKPTEVRLYLSKEDERRAGELFKRVGSQLSRNKALSIVLSAGLAALEEAGWVSTLPLRFVVKLDNTPLHERETAGETQIFPKPPRRKRGK